MTCTPSRGQEPDSLREPRFIGATPDMPERADELELTRLSHELTSWQEPFEALRTSALTRPSLFTGPLIALPESRKLDTDVFEAIRNRRSFRAFTDQPVTREELGTIARHAVAAMPDWVSSRLVQLHVAVRGVEGIDRGVYRYVPEEHALSRIASGDAP